MSQSYSNQQILEMIHHLEDGVISSDEQRQLMEQLRTSKETRKAYIKHMKFVNAMRTEAMLEYGAGIDSDARNKRRSTFFSVTAAAAILMLLAVAGYIIRTSTLSHPVSNITLTGNYDSVWSITSPDEQVGPDNIMPGTKISIRKGTVALRFPSSVEAILEGPASIKIVSHQEMHISHGRGWFRVGPKDHGYTVTTNHLKIVDLGTEFGIASDEDGHEQVHVASGKVLVSARRNPSRTIELVAGQAVATWLTEKLEKIPYQQESFLQKLPNGTPYIHWSFDSLENGVLAADGTMPNTDHFPVRSRSFFKQAAASPIQARGRFGQALHLAGGTAYATSDFPGIGGNLPRTIALWVKLTPEQAQTQYQSPYVPGLVGWGNPYRLHTHWRVGIKNSAKAQNLTTLWGSEYSATPVKQRAASDGAWHHLAFVYTGACDDNGQPVIRHYLDGKRQEKMFHSTSHIRIKTDTTSPRAQTMRLGPDARDGQQHNTFSGLIDELFIFRGVLTEGQINKLMHTNAYDKVPAIRMKPQSTTTTS